MDKKLLHTLPKHWSWVKIDDIGVVVSGGTPSTKEPEFWGDEVPWITPADLSKYQDIYISNGKRSLTNIGLEYSSATLLPMNSILFSSRAPIGYVAIAKNELATNQGFKNIVLSDHINSKYVYYYLKTVKELAEELASGTTFLELSGTKFKDIPFPLSPIEEQNRIVEKIEEIFSDLDKSLSDFDNTIKTINLQKKNIINRGIKGKLTELWRENRSIVNPQILDKLRPLSIKNKKVPTDWLYVQLGDLSPKITDGTHHTPTYIEEGVNFVSVKDIKNGLINFENTKYISKEEHEILTKRCNPEQGDILITKSGTIGRLAIVPSEPKFSLFVSVALIKVDKNILDSKYLLYCLENFISSINISEDIKGAVQKNFHLEDIRTTRIPYCSLEEQQKIVEEIEVSIQNLEALENDIIKAKNGTDLLYRKTLREAFSAKLTLNHYNDTSVILSLENITAAKKKYLETIIQKRSKKKIKRTEIDLLNIIQNNFPKSNFTYYELFEIANIKKETLTIEFNKLEQSKKISSLFDDIGNN